MIDIPITKKMKNIAINYQYNHKIFMFPFWMDIYINDAERKQNVDEAEKTFYFLKNEYNSFGYEIIEVPLFSPQKRAEFILDHLY